MTPLISPARLVASSRSAGILESGLTPLVNGHAYIVVVFPSPLPGTSWNVLCSVINTADATPLNIWPGIVTAKATTGFTVQLNGMPDTANYYLYWAIAPGGVMPDSTTYTLSGPSSGTVSVASTNFTVALPVGGTITGTATVTPSDGGGGTFTPAAVHLTTAAPSATFTYTPASAGTKTISVTNSGGLTDPAPLTYTVSALAYTLSGPSTGTVGTPSTNFTVTLPAGVVGTVVVTPHDAAGGGTFAPTSLSLVASGSGTFTYTAASAGAKTISVTNSGGLTDPGNLTYTASVPVTPHLLNTLISYWKLDETGSVTRNDAQSANHLTLGALPNSTTGKINNGANFVSASGNYAGIASNTSLQVTGDFAFSLWLKMTASALKVPLSKWGSAGMEYAFIYDPATGIQFATNSGVSADVAIGPTLSIGTWYHLVSWFDSATGLTHLRINDATTYSGTVTTTAVARTGQFIIGGAESVVGGFYIDAVIDEVGFWKRKLTAQEITALYNGGSGLAYSSFTA